MSYKLIVSPFAAKNIENAVEYYINKAGKKIGLHFLNDLQKTYNALKINPFYQFHDNNYRFYPLVNFLMLCFLSLMRKIKGVYKRSISYFAG